MILACLPKGIPSIQVAMLCIIDIEEPNVSLSSASFQPSVWEFTKDPGISVNIIWEFRVFKIIVLL